MDSITPSRALTAPEREALRRWRSRHHDDVRWPHFSTAELRRLRFIAYNRTHGYMHPPAPTALALEGLFNAIDSYLNPGRRHNAQWSWWKPPLNAATHDHLRRAS